MIKLLKYELKDISRPIILGIVVLIVLNILVFSGYQILGDGVFSEIEVTKTEDGFGFGTKSLLGLGIIFCYLLNFRRKQLIALP